MLYTSGLATFTRVAYPKNKTRHPMNKAEMDRALECFDIGLPILRSVLSSCVCV